ncbi:unnamed protein product [Pleuronectes platessa]|uniref:Uncharacterized protein n=1 Tax=Pleuronectes platessa TaxID=8262 RepID=A0A9N7VL40_PLEPL|nr:unnamed protein product [Pleuronectes platessa]
MVVGSDAGLVPTGWGGETIAIPNDSHTGELPLPLDLFRPPSDRHHGLNTNDVLISLSSRPNINNVTLIRDRQLSRHEHTPVRRRDSGKTQAPKPSQNPAGQHDDTQLQILAAIRGLSERLGRVEAQYPATTARASRHGQSSPDRLPSYQEENVVHPDILSLSMLKIPFLKVMGSLRVLLG